MEIQISLNEQEVLVLATCLAVAPQGPPVVEDLLNGIALKILDAQDLASIPVKE
jgi:hypothetical protein